MSAAFPFFFNTRTWLGRGARDQLPVFIGERGWRRVAAVVDPGVGGVPVVRALLDAVRADGVELAVVPGPTREPTYDDLEERRAAAAGCDAVIGIGGGSSLDVAKGLAVLARNTGPALSYRGFDKATEPVLPVLALPTTAGSGSEITPNASFVDAAAKKKMGINGEAVRPVAAFVDPELTLSCPPRASAAAGMDAVVHASEAFVSHKSNPIARLFAARAVRLLLDHLPAVARAPDSLPDREAVQLGSFLAAVALMNAGTGVASALSYPLSTDFNVPHGWGGGFFLPHVVAFNVSRGARAYADLEAEAFGASTAPDGSGYARRLRDAWTALGVPATLAGLDVGGPGAVDTIVRGTLELRGALDQNPIAIDEAALRDIIGRTL